MGHRAMQYVAFFAGAMGMLVGAGALVRELRNLTVSTATPAVDNALVLVALAFVTMCLMGGIAAAALKAQAGTIADLERRLATLQRAN